MSNRATDILVVGAGAAGLMAALAARGAVDREGRELAPTAGAPEVVLLDASPRVGLKILLSGGGRCNVTNERVTELDFVSDAPHLVRGFLRAFPAESVRTFFESRGCALEAEPLGKLFPRSGRAADVLGVLLSAIERAGARLFAGVDVVGLARDAASGAWTARTAGGEGWRAGRVVLASGGKSLPKTGSRGFGFEAAAALGHRVEAPLPALTPILLDAAGPLAGLAGVTVPALLSLVPRGTPPEQVSGTRFRPLARAAGSFLATHLGASGPAALDVSGACGRALQAREDVQLFADFWTLTREDSPFAELRRLPKPPGASLPTEETPRPVTFEEFTREIRSTISDGRRALATALSARLPRSLAESLLRGVGVAPSTPAAQVTPPQWRRVHEALTRCDLRLAGTDGYLKAEVTRGGILLGELDRLTLESRVAPGLHACGEVVNVTGRLGGFNFQWAWSSGFAAGAGAARSARSRVLEE
jgi:predicted Rossmann fold flavoprotein